MEETQYDYSSLKKAIESKLRKALDAKKDGKTKSETSELARAVPHKIKPRIGFLDGKNSNLPSTISKTVDLSSGNLPEKKID